MQYFNRDNSEIFFIKNLLMDDYVPTVRFFNSWNNIQPTPNSTKVWTNLYDLSTISEQTTDLNNDVFKGETIILDKSVQVKDRQGNLKYISKYDFGKRYNNITTNYISNKPYYDSGLHEYLGRYLRAYRDFYRIDVMNLYNCFSNRYITSFSLPFKSYKDGIVPYDSNFKLTAFPIEFDTDYHILFSGEYVGNVTIQAIYFNGDVPLRAVELDTDGNAITYNVSVGKDLFVRIGSYGKQEKMSRSSLLYLFLQYPSSVDYGIVSLEQPKFTYAINNELENIKTYNNEQIAFSDTLLEYLSGSVISPATKTLQDVKKIQDKMVTEKFFNKFGVCGPNYALAPQGYKFTSGVYDFEMQKLVYLSFYNLVDFSKYSSNMNNPNIKFGNPIPNFMGFVDKNVERIFDEL